MVYDIVQIPDGGNGALRLASRAPFANEVGGTETEETRASSFVHTKTSFYPITPFIRFRVDLQIVSDADGPVTGLERAHVISLVNFDTHEHVCRISYNSCAMGQDSPFCVVSSNRGYVHVSFDIRYLHL